MHTLDFGQALWSERTGVRRRAPVPGAAYYMSALAMSDWAKAIRRNRKRPTPTATASWRPSGAARSATCRTSPRLPSPSQIYCVTWKLSRCLTSPIPPVVEKAFSDAVRLKQAFGKMQVGINFGVPLNNAVSVYGEEILAACVGEPELATWVLRQMAEAIPAGLPTR